MAGVQSFATPGSGVEEAVTSGFTGSMTFRSPTYGLYVLEACRQEVLVVGQDPVWVMIGAAVVACDYTWAAVLSSVSRPSGTSATFTASGTGINVSASGACMLRSRAVLKTPGAVYRF